MELDEEDRVREERATASVLRRARLVAAVAAVVQFSLYQPPPDLTLPFERFPVAVGVVAGLLVVNAVSLLTTRSRRYRVVRAGAHGEMVVDAAMVLLLVWLFSFDPNSALWGLLVLPVLEAAIRASLRGALVMWALMVAAYIVRNLWAAGAYPQVEFNVDGVTYVAGILGVVALSVGMTAQRLHQRTLEHRAARGQAEVQVAELNRTRRALAYRASHDTLTGLANRSQFVEQLQRALGEEGSDARVGVVFADLDDLKDVNDRHGHAAGDELLRQFGERLRAHMRGQDTTARLGGDEFTVLVDGVAATDELVAVAERLVEAAREPFVWDGAPVTTSVSVGVALGRPGIDTADEVLGAADTAMYDAKHRGGDRWTLGVPASADAEAERCGPGRS